MSAQGSSFDIALDTAATAVAGLKTAINALEEIAQLNSMCPLASEIAVRGLCEVKAVVVTELAAEHYLRELRLVGHVQDGLVSEDALDAALGEGRR